MLFSERYGYKPVREVIQIDSVDEPLRNGLWNILKVFVWDRAERPPGPYRVRLSGYGNKELSQLCNALWFSFFKKPLDQLDDDWTETHEELRRYFFECQWYELYDFVEFVANHYSGQNFKKSFSKACNTIFERELAAYRFVDGLIIRVTEQQEIKAVEDALEKAEAPVRLHLRRALELLADKNTPDYRNSIKESISAVESLAALTIGESGTLGQLIKKLEQQIGLHPALGKAFNNLYGYTSDEGGIRHALADEETADFDHAKFMLIACSAFVGFVLSKVKIEG